ncbi:hypothetical protein F5884DRAFT_458196 [Xylogone sp. PMI_703]|nr:hypothetical protein F5884DRAFT_458196 [Xylogone sp. PMI_703]
MYFLRLLRRSNIFPPRLQEAGKSAFSIRFRSGRRFESTGSEPSDVQAAKSRERAERVLKRVPKPLRKYTDGLRNAPVSHVVAFLILHELTAIVPLVGLASLFHYTQWLPTSFTNSEYISQGTERFGRYFRRKGWFGFSNEEQEGNTSGSRLNGNGTRILVEVATAYAITKVLLPARIILSVWATPWFARVFIGKIGGGIKKLFGRSAT